MSVFATRRLWIAVFVAAGVTACTVRESPPKFPLGRSATTERSSLSADARAALDLGNTEFRAGRYDSAMAAYRAAVKAAPDNAAPYFGIYMTAKKLGNSSLADSATAAIAARNGPSLMLSDSSMKALHATSASR
ncbi:MAG TPA: tetratricopeptide repeat protein [Gemmatimonadaceae bacterium]|jgi:Flp pilus assembly protein TadD